MQGKESYSFSPQLKQKVMKKTTAILGDRGDFFLEVVQVLMTQDLRLLFVSEDESKKLEMLQHLEHQEPNAEIEFLSCERDGCWEADIIVLVNPQSSSASLVNKIREVATQKIVMVVFEDTGVNEKPQFRELLPFSKVVEVNFDTLAKEISFCSEDAEAKKEVQQLFRASGFHEKQ